MFTYYFDSINKIFNKIFQKLLTLLLYFLIVNNKNTIIPRLERLGSNYGGWYLCCSMLTENSHVLSLGAGEDISFDAEIANKYGCSVDIFDPTPKAVKHFSKLKQQIGKKSLVGYSKIGAQDIRSYDLTNVSKRQISFFPKAVWTNKGRVQFFVPLNKNSVSHTITGYNSKSNEGRKSIQVDCIDILDVQIEKYEVLKLDIEGAEIPVLKRLIENTDIAKLPKQILVEFDELQIPEFKNFWDVYSFDKDIRKIGYQLIKKDKYNFTYFKGEI